MLNNHTSRRKFIANTGKAAIATRIASSMGIANEIPI